MNLARLESDGDLLGVGALVEDGECQALVRLVEFVSILSR